MNDNKTDMRERVNMYSTCMCSRVLIESRDGNKKLSIQSIFKSSISRWKSAEYENVFYRAISLVLTRLNILLLLLLLLIYCIVKGRLKHLVRLLRIHHIAKSQNSEFLFSSQLLFLSQKICFIHLISAHDSPINIWDNFRKKINF